MAKGDDVVARKKNKANRKKLRSKDKDSSSSVSARVAAIIAAKKRRKSGKRRKCQGMCFSLPTPDDPFNERNGNKDFNKKETKITPSKASERMFSKEKRTKAPNETLQESDLKVGLNVGFGGPLTNDNIAKRRKTDPDRTEFQANEKGGVQGYQGEGSENSISPSKFLILCLNAIENAMYHDLIDRTDKPLFVDTWGIEFWKYYSSGQDILETSGFPSTDEQIAWVVSSAADSIARKEKEGLVFSSPFLLFLVPTQEKATKVRSLCKPLKDLGVHTVSIHPGASIDHQIEGLKSCEPEFLVSTPERLLELVSMEAIDISGVSLLVVDGLESLSSGGYLNMIKSIRNYMPGYLHTIVFSDSFNCTYVPVVQDLLKGSIYRLSLNVSVASQSACIIQSINFCTSREEKRSKIIQALDQANGSILHPQLLKVLITLGKECEVHELAATLKSKGYNVLAGSISEFKSNLEIDSRLRPVVSMIDREQINTTDLGNYEIVFIHDAFPSIDKYVQILTGMARHSVNGVLHSFITKEEASVAGSLVEILEQCGQSVPETVRNLCLTQGTS